MFALGDVRDAVKRLQEASERLEKHWNEEGENPLLAFYVKIMANVLDAERCSIFISDPESGRVWLKCGTGVTERSIQVTSEGSIVGMVVASGEPMIMHDLEDREGPHKAIDAMTGFTTRNTICIPIRTLGGKRITGAVQVLNKKAGARFTEQDRLVLEEAAHYLEVAIEGIYFNQEVSSVLTKMVKVTRASLISAVGALMLATGMVIYYLANLT